MTAKKLTVAEVADRISTLDDPALVELLTDVYTRLNAQATLVRKIRDSDSQPAPASRPSKTVEGVGRTALGSPGVFVSNTHCYECGTRKPEDRKMVLCAECGSKRQRALQSGSPLRYKRCGNCGKSLNGRTHPLCGKCAPAYAKWRDDN